MANIPFIAIIDDDDVLCSSLVDLMRSSGHRAEPFASAEAFLASPHLALFDCVIADVHLPGMTGLDLVRRFRQHESATPIILITALPGEVLGDEAVAVGAQCLLRKPFEAQALLEWIEKNVADGSRSPRHE
jgi:FixJ family two-component response regulator